MTLGWSDTGPEAEAILSYSQSGDPESPHFDDQTQLYAEKTWRQYALRRATSKPMRYRGKYFARLIEHKKARGSGLFYSTPQSVWGVCKIISDISSSK